MLMVLVLMTTVVLRLAVVIGAIYLLLPRGPVCRACDVDMARIRNRFLERWLPVLERRWCLECGWSGVVRRGPRFPRPMPRASQPTPPTWE